MDGASGSDKQAGSCPDGRSYPIGPIGYVYARSTDTINGDEWRLLCAKSADQPSSAIAPLICGLTVEKDFKPNVAAVVATKSSGMSGGHATAILAPAHYAPSVYIFYGGDAIRPTTNAPGLTKVCEEARSRFGFTAVSPNGPVDNAVETTGAEICASLGMDPGSTMLYLVCTSLFCEAVYLCNSYLHLGSADTVTIGNDAVRRVPLYPVQLHMPEIALRLCRTPFDRKSRSIGEGCVYPTPFFNRDLNRLLHGAVLGPQGVILRTRDLDAVARGAAFLAYDGNFDGCVLSGDKTFTQFAPDTNGASKAMSQKGTSEVERRAACSLAAEIALSTRVNSASAPHQMSVLPYDEWPIFDGAHTPDERVSALGRFAAELAGIVGGAVFACNSALYMTEVIDSGAPEQSDRPQVGLNRFYLACGLHSAGCPQVDYSGKVVFGGTCCSTVNPPNNFDFEPHHLAYACGFSPELLARVTFYLERCSRQQLGTRLETNPLKFAASSLGEPSGCEWCTRDTRLCCIRQTLYRLRSRLPVPRAVRRGPVGIIGAVDNDYTDCDVLGNFAPYSQLKKAADNEAARAVMQDTYRGLSARLFQFMVSEGWVNRDSGADAVKMENAADLRRVVERLKETVDAECGKFIQALAGARGYHYKDQLGSIAHTFGISVNPYSTGYCPVLSLLADQSRAVLWQDLALCQVHATFDKRNVDTKMFRSTVMPSLRAAFHGMLDKGFLSGRNEPVSLSPSAVTAPDTTRPQTDGALIQYEYSLNKSQALKLKEFKIKNRVLFSGSAMAGEARSRVQGLADAFTRPGPSKVINVLNGPLGFILKRDHKSLFGPEMDAFKFWNLIITGHMPKRCLTKDAIDTLSFIRCETKSYTANNYIKTPPTTLLELANFMMANKILNYCGYGSAQGGYYISTPSAVVLSAGPNKEHGAELAWLPAPSDSTVDALASAIAAAIADREASGVHLDKWMSTSTVSNSCRMVLNTKPVIMIGLMVSKYTGQQSSTTVFQAGNWAGLTGTSGVHGVNAALSYDPVRKSVLACRRIGVVLNNGLALSGGTDGSLVSQIRSVLAETGYTPSGVYLAALRALGENLRDVTAETWSALAEDQFLVDALESINLEAASAPGGWTIESATEAAKRYDSAALPLDDRSDDEMIDFGDCEDVSVQPTTPNAMMNPERDDDAPPIKRPALTTGVLFC